MLTTYLPRTLLALLLPSTFLAVLCVGGAALRTGARLGSHRHRVGRLLLGAGLIGLAVVVLLPVDEWSLRPLEDRFPAPTLPAHVDGIVVLGGAIAMGVTADRGIPVLDREGDRLMAFAILARAHPEARLVFSGGTTGKEAGHLTEAQATRRLLDQLGLAPDRVMYESQSRTTWENAVDSLALARPGPGETWVLVTSADHMPRAMGAFHEAGWPPMWAWPVAYRTTPKTWAGDLRPVAVKLAGLDAAAHEWLGLLAYWARGRADRLFPGPGAP